MAEATATLPVRVNSFVGREGEIAEVRKLLEASRLVTLVGAGGVGKTRLALELAGQLAPDYPGGASFVELAPIADPGVVWQAVASGIGVREQPGCDLRETVVGYLRHRRLLLILDNCEHLIQACAEVAEMLLRSCPELIVVATSREPLSIAGEVAWRVPSLSVPDPADVVPESVAASDAVRLFVERARAARPSFELTQQTAPAVAEICRRLDGIPLAIELAAARIPVLSAGEIAARLDDRFQLLTGGSRTALPRQQTLLAAVAWGHDLLSNPERTLLRRLSVFAGGWTLSAAEQVCVGGDLTVDRVLDLLASLVTKSLVVADTERAEARYRLLETIREYARHQLSQAGETDQWRARHALWGRELAERAEPELCGADQQIWLNRLEEERDNLRSALEWLIKGGHHEEALRLTGALTLFWRVRGHFSEGREWLEMALAADQIGSDSLRAKALWGLALLIHMLGDNAAAVSLAGESLALARAADDPLHCGRALLVLGNCHRYLEGPAKAIPLLQQSAALARHAGDGWCLAASLAMCGWAFVARGAGAEARSCFEECVAVSRARADKQSLTRGLDGLGYLALTQGDYRSAERLLEETLAVAHDVGESYAMVAAMTALGELAIGQGEYGRARALLHEALARGREVHSFSAIAGPLLCMGRLAQAQGDFPEARRCFEEVVAMVAETASTSAPPLLNLGEARQALGDAAAARALFEDALQVAQDTDNKAAMARALHDLGNLVRDEGDRDRASSLHHQALSLYSELGDRRGIAEGLEALAGLAAELGRPEQAARLFGSVESLRDENRYVRPRAEAARYDAAVALARSALPTPTFEAAWADGRALSQEEAIEYATRSRGPRGRPATGWESLTKAEREVVRLVADGLTNREISDRLFMSRGTVKAHLSHIFAKLDVGSRLELAMVASRRGHSPQAP